MMAFTRAESDVLAVNVVDLISPNDDFVDGTQLPDDLDGTQPLPDGEDDIPVDRLVRTWSFDDDDGPVLDPFMDSEIDGPDGGAEGEATQDEVKIAAGANVSGADVGAPADGGDPIAADLRAEPEEMRQGEGDLGIAAPVEENNTKDEDAKRDGEDRKDEKVVGATDGARIYAGIVGENVQQPQEEQQQQQAQALVSNAAPVDASLNDTECKARIPRR